MGSAWNSPSPLAPFPLGGVDARSLTGHQSSRPACDERLTVNFARTVARGCGVDPNNFSITGTTNKYPFTNALTGLPGNPITALPLHTPRMVGLPGRVLIPCTSTPGEPSEPITSAVISRVDAEEPAVMRSRSHSSRAFAAALCRASNWSVMIPYRFATPPLFSMSALNVYELTSRTWPGRGA